MEGEVRLVIDGIDKGILSNNIEEWRHREYVKAPHIHTLLEIMDDGEMPTTDPPIIKKLKIYGRVHRFIPPLLAVFCYDLSNPTSRQWQEDRIKFLMTLDGERENL